MSKPSVFLTGADGGIGMAIVRSFSQRPFRVLAGVRSQASFDAIGAAFDPQAVLPVRLDVTDERQCAAAVEVVEREVGSSGLHGLVNNAGIIVQGPIELLSPNDLVEQYAVNVVAPMTLIRLLLPLLRAARGRIVNIGAATGRVSVPMLGAVASSKAALASLNDALRMEVQPWGVAVSLIEPGAMATTIFARAAERAARLAETNDPATVELYAERLAGFSEAMDKQKTTSPEVVARAVVHALTAARPRNRYLVGSDARVLNVLKHVPDGMRDGMMRSSLGLNPKRKRETRETVAVARHR